jgi:hypothetical protein
MTDKQTKRNAVMFNCENSWVAMEIADEMNRLNKEAARLTGQAIRFFYTILPTSKAK